LSAIWQKAKSVIESIGFPAVIRPSFTLGGTGGGIAFNNEEYEEIVQRGLDLSPMHEVLVEESVLGWKEYELEVMRDLKDNVVIICSIEEFRSDGRSHGRLDHGGAGTNVDGSRIPTNARRVRCSHPPDWSRDGRIQYPVCRQSKGRTAGCHRDESPGIAKFRAGFKGDGISHREDRRKACGRYTLNEIPNDITKKTPASFEPTLDYVVVKIPKWAFEKFRSPTRRSEPR
jgi:carbamoyl-phosphate synthase large subunit